MRAVLEARWPAEAGVELRAHAAECHACRVVADLARALRDDYVRTVREVDVPPPGLVWQRAIVRSRTEAAQRASVPVAWAQGVTAACIGGAALAAAVLSWPTMRGAAGRVADAAGRDWLGLASPLLEAVDRSQPLALVVAGCVLAMPLLALYFAWSSERGD